MTTGDADTDARAFTAQAACLVCGAMAVPVGTKHDQRVFECSRCTLRFVPPHQTREATALYTEKYFTGAESEYGDYVGEEPAHRRQARRYLKRLARFRQPGVMLDVGGATGFFAHEAQKAGWQVDLVEISDYAASHAREELGLAVVQGEFPRVELKHIPYDVITFFNVFEHLDAPRDAEARLRDIVAPGGVVAIETWDWGSMVAKLLGLAWHQYQPEYVPCYYNRKSLLTLFTPADWECLVYGAGTKWISLRRAVGILAAKHGAHALRAMGDGPLGSIDLPYRLGDLVWVVFRRRPDAGTRDGY